MLLNFKKITMLVASFAMVGGVALSSGLLTKNDDRFTEVTGAGPYKILGDFNTWSETVNTKDITNYTTRIDSSKVYYAKHTIYGQWKMHGSDVTWLGVGNLNDQAKGAGFSGTDNIISPDATAPGSEHTFLVYETNNRINVVKDAYLAGSMNSWTAGDASKKFTQDVAKPWIFTYETTFNMSDSFKINFGGWDGALGAYNITTESSIYGFISSGDPDHNITTDSSFYSGNYIVELDLANYLIDISPKAGTVSAQIMSYSGGDVLTSECESKYDLMKPRVINMTSAEINTFKTSSDSTIANARARYTQWAVANGENETQMYSSPSTNGHNNDGIVRNAEMNLGMILTIGAIGLTIMAGFLLLKRKQ